MSLRYDKHQKFGLSLSDKSLGNDMTDAGSSNSGIVLASMCNMTINRFVSACFHTVSYTHLTLPTNREV